MKAARETAYALLAAQRPRPRVAGDLCVAFAARFTKQGGICARLRAIDELPGYVFTHFGTGDSALEVILAEDPLLSAAPWSTQPGVITRIADTRPIGPIALTTAFAGVAETGSLAVHPRAGAPMALNFLPDRLLIVLRAEDMLANLEDFWQRTRERFGTTLPRGLCLVSGPSSTGDIAMSITTGVHGPIEVHALIVG